MDGNNLYTDSAKFSDMGSNDLNNGRFSNRAARFYWADDEPSPQKAYSIQQVSKISSADSHFEDSPLVIASISAGVIGVAIIIVILVGIWIRSRLFSDEGEGRENPTNISVRSSMSTLEEETYVVCMEMNGAVLDSTHKSEEHDDDNCENNSVTIEMEESKEPSSTCVPEIISPNAPALTEEDESAVESLKPEVS